MSQKSPQYNIYTARFTPEQYLNDYVLAHHAGGKKKCGRVFEPSEPIRHTTHFLCANFVRFVLSNVNNILFYFIVFFTHSTRYVNVVLGKIFPLSHCSKM